MAKTILSIMKNVKLFGHVAPPLGRWSHKCEKSQNLKCIMANHDSCGGELCSKPISNKEIQKNDKEFYLNQLYILETHSIPDTKIN
jgi:hypothetical protein